VKVKITIELDTNSEDDEEIILRVIEVLEKLK